MYRAVIAICLLLGLSTGSSFVGLFMRQAVSPDSQVKYRHVPKGFSDKYAYSGLESSNTVAQNIPGPSRTNDSGLKDEAFPGHGAQVEMQTTTGHLGVTEELAYFRDKRNFFYIYFFHSKHHDAAAVRHDSEHLLAVRGLVASVMSADLPSDRRSKPGMRQADPRADPHT